MVIMGSSTLSLELGTCLLKLDVRKDCQLSHMMCLGIPVTGDCIGCLDSRTSPKQAFILKNHQKGN